MIAEIGEVLRETEKAILMQNDWFPKSAIVERLKVQSLNDRPGREREELIILKFDPRRLRLKNSLHADAVTVDGRRWHKHGLAGWQQDESTQDGTDRGEFTKDGTFPTWRRPR